MFANNLYFNFNNIDIHPTYCLRVHKVISKNVNYLLISINIICSREIRGHIHMPKNIKSIHIIR